MKKSKAKELSFKENVTDYSCFPSEWTKAILRNLWDLIRKASSSNGPVNFDRISVEFFIKNPAKIALSKI